MFDFFRRHQRKLMLVIAILTIIAFVWLYNSSGTDMGNMGADKVGQIYGRTLRTVDVDRIAKMYRMAFALGQVDLVTTLSGRSEDEGQAISNFVFNTLVLRHEAKQLRLDPTVDQIADAVRAIPAMQTNGTFDFAKYQQFLQEQMAPRGFTGRELDEVVADGLRLARLREILGSTAAVAPVEREAAKRAFQPINGWVVRLNEADFAAAAVVPEDAIRKFYDENATRFVTEELRAVNFARFPISETDSKAGGKARIDALQKQADAASEFLVKADAPGANFNELATAAGATLGTTPPFSRVGAVSEGATAPDGLDLPALADAAFKLSAESPNSDVVQAGDAFYVLHMGTVTPSRQLTFEEATPEITAELKAQAGLKAMEQTAQSTRKALTEALASGKSFPDAVAALGLKTDRLEGVVAADPAGDPELRGLAGSTLALEAAQLSGFEPAPWGGFFVFLEKRGDVSSLPPDQLAQVDAALLNRQKTLVFAEWLRLARESSGIKVFQN